MAVEYDIESVSRAMDSTVTALRALVIDAMSATVLGNGTPLDVLTHTVFGQESSTDAVRGALAADSRNIDELDTVLRGYVQSGAWTPEQWRDRAILIQQDINAQVGYDSDNGGISALWSTVVVQTVKDVGGAVQNAIPSTGEVNFLVIAAVAGLLLILLIKVN
jgi:hypothetical protein